MVALSWYFRHVPQLELRLKRFTTTLLGVDRVSLALPLAAAMTEYMAPGGEGCVCVGL